MVDRPEEDVVLGVLRMLVFLSRGMILRNRRRIRLVRFRLIRILPVRRRPDVLALIDVQESPGMIERLDQSDSIVLPE